MAANPKTPLTPQEQPKSAQCAALDMLAARGARGPQFPKLSERPVSPDARMPLDNPIDKIPLEKFTLKEPTEKLDKDIKPFILDTNERICFAVMQSKHQNAIQQELRALLEHERKLLVQLQERANKFSQMKDDNKKQVVEWENEHNERMPFYTQFLQELMAIPDSECLTQEGVPNEVNKKILFKIVEKTCSVANNSITQLNMQITLVHDIDTKLDALKRFCTFMMNHIDGWLKRLGEQTDNQAKILEEWDAIKEKIRILKEGDENASIGSEKYNTKDVKKLEERILMLETTVSSILEPLDAMKGCPPNQKGNGGRPVATRQAQMPDMPAEDPKSGYAGGQCDFTPEESNFGADDGADYSEMYNTDHAAACPPQPQQQCQEWQSPISSRQEGPRPVPRRGRPEEYSQRYPANTEPMPHAEMPGFSCPPRSATERMGRGPELNPQQCTPGNFRPGATSTPKPQPQAANECPPQIPPNPLGAQVLEDKYIEKVRGTFERFERRSRELEDLTSQFRDTKKTLQDEMDKAVQLKSRLERDLYYIEKEATARQQGQDPMPQCQPGSSHNQ